MSCGYCYALASIAAAAAFGAMLNSARSGMTSGPGAYEADLHELSGALGFRRWGSPQSVDERSLDPYLYVSPISRDRQVG